jgi:Tol biopolymer transport system component
LALTSGVRLGSYEIVCALGAGGMGEVYKATDTNLKRSVAIKVLPASVADDAERLARFQREAEVLAALNHPNIAAIYGILDRKATGSHVALIMELVEGEDLSAVIGRGALPLTEAVPIARQIAEALEAAHEQGIVHRDLKPQNIKVRADGTVKVLDFGLAKALGPEGTSAAADAMHSPTLTARATQMGVILGTAAYMAPEQARGRAVDKRADIWAFGVVLYEMLTGTRLFDGEDVSETLAAVLTRDVPLASLPGQIPSPVRALIRDCLARDPKQRLRDIGDARLALSDTIAPPPPDGPARQPLSRALAAVAIVSLALAAFVGWWKQPALPPKTTIRFTLSLPPGQEVTSYPAITRDGRTIAYVTQQGTGDAQLYLRDLGSFEPRIVAGASGARQPFFSPDGKWIAFFAQGQLQKAEVAGGAPVHLAEAPYPFGGTWNEDGTIIYTTSLGSGLLRIPAGGGKAEALTRPDGAAQGYAHVFPQGLPGGKRVLFTVWGQGQGAAVLSLDTGRSDLVLPNAGFGAAVFQANDASRGRLLVVDGSSGVRAAPFDTARQAPTSIETSLLDNVNFDVETESRPWLAISETGTAVYAPGNPTKTSLVWVDRQGRVEAVGAGLDEYREAVISPDGLHAVVRHDLDLWIHDLQRGTRSRLTSGSGSNIMPLWRADGTRIVFASNRGGDWDIYTQPADGSRPAEALLKRPRDQFPLATLADGTLLYTEIAPDTGRDLWILSPDGKSSPLRITPYNEMGGQFSPGPAGGPRWLAYVSDESGQNEIYVQSYPGGGQRVAISSGGGILPTWSPDGRELFYVSGDALMAVPMQADGSAGAPRRLFDRSTMLFNHRFHSYSVSPDGKRFLMIQRDPTSIPRQLNVIVNW